MSHLFKITALFYGLLVPCLPASGQAVTQKKHFHISFAPLFSVENFHWSIAGNAKGTNPNILSELNFIRLRRTGFCLEGQYQFSRRFTLKAAAARQYGYSGRVTDIDYAGNNRSLPVTFLKFRSRNNTHDYRVRCNYLLFRSGIFSLAAQAGYFISKAGYRIQGPAATHAKSSYNAQWRGPFLGIEGQIRLPQNWEIRANINSQYHTYHAEADWRLRSVFSHPLSFVHHATGWGAGGSLGLHYQLGLRVGLQLNSSLQHWRTGAGSDHLYMADGRRICTRMNESVKTQLGVGLAGIFGF
ncbi:hypothetical protein LL912_13455 [Niabella sp. CC-SYL272]|uniref:hypothetical protein n=1 Tax=Niabella agricola TaxID=2891571 RepID=UPI001F3A83D7|nr:hypothetical protein [Niabella agricola]MCF3109781.1 hypothetical protein [Niabella agricola]